MTRLAALTYHLSVNRGHLRHAVTSFAIVFIVTSAAAQQRPANGAQLASQLPPPGWAYAVNPARAAGEPTGDTLQHIPNSKQTYTLSQIGDLFTVPDWHPDAHPSMPEVVARGRMPDVYACAYCHLPNGMGRPENASLAGLPKQYIVNQMAAFQSGARKSSEPKLLPVNNMIAVAAHANPQDASAGAAYFSSLKPRKWIRIVETATVPRTHVAGWMLVPDQPIAQEPIRQRIIETPENLQLTELRDDTSGFVAYVPQGSMKRGKQLVEKGGDGLTVPCATCHGRDLRGKDDVPSISGRSPSYVMRQLYDLQIGSRGGPGTGQMQAPAMKLSMDDMLAIAAYLASLRP